MSWNHTNSNHNLLATLDEKLNFETGNQQAALIVYSIFLADVFLCFCISVCFCLAIQIARNRRLELLNRLSILEANQDQEHFPLEPVRQETEIRGIPVTNLPLDLSPNIASEDGVPSAPPITLLYAARV